MTASTPTSNPPSPKSKPKGSSTPKQRRVRSHDHRPRTLSIFCRTTHPPSVALPRSGASKSSMSSPLIDLSPSNCPPAFKSFLLVWVSSVLLVQSLPPNTSTTSRAPWSAFFKSGPRVSPTSSNPPSSPSRSNRPASTPASQLPADSSSTAFHLLPSPSSALASSTSFLNRKTPSPTLLPPNSLAISPIRETLYAALGDAPSSRPSLLPPLSTSTTSTPPSTDKPRIYYAALTLAILDGSQSNITLQGSIIGVLGNELLHPLMGELAEIGRVRREVEDEDNEEAVKAAQNGKCDFQTWMERVRKVLEGGIGWDLDSRSSSANRDGKLERRRTRSIEGRAMAFTNRINALALKIAQLPQFRERFAVLAALTPPL